MRYFESIVILQLIFILCLSIFIFYLLSNSPNKEGLTPGPQGPGPQGPTLRCPLKSNGEIDFKCYDRQIANLTNAYNYLMARVPITFYAGNIEYHYQKPGESDLPLVVFSGGVPYVYVNMRLPYPSVGDKGDTGDPGPQGPNGDTGSTGNPGLSGYSGLNYSSYLMNTTV